MRFRRSERVEFRVVVREEGTILVSTPPMPLHMARRVAARWQLDGTSLTIERRPLGGTWRAVGGK